MSYLRAKWTDNNAFHRLIKNGFHKETRDTVILHQVFEYRIVEGIGYENLIHVSEQLALLFCKDTNINHIMMYFRK